MLTSWLKPVRPATRPTTRGAFAPQVVQLEDRAVPAVFYVDPTFTGAAGSTATFNAGYPSPVAAGTTATIGTTGFADLGQAILASETSTADPVDTIYLAHGTIALNNTANDPVLGNATNITQSLNIIGSGEGASVIQPTNGTLFAGAPDQGTALLRIDGTAGGVAVNFVGFRLDGTGKDVGTGITVTGGAAATLTQVAVSGTIIGTTPAQNGTAIFVQQGTAATGNVSTLAVTDSDLTNYGFEGITAIDGTSISVINSRVIGRGAGNFVQNGIEVDGATAFISGSVISDNNGRTPGITSDGVLGTRGITTPTVGANVLIIGSTIRNNGVGVTTGISSTAPDPSTLFISNSNIFANEVGSDGSNASTPILAPNNYWGTPTGPFAAPTNTTPNATGTGNPAINTNLASTSILYPQFLPVAGPLVSVPNTGVQGIELEAYNTAVTNVPVIINPAVNVDNPTGSSLLTAAPTGGVVDFTVTFNTPVTGFDVSDLVVTSANGATLTPTISGSGSSYTVSVSGVTAGDTVSVSINPRSTFSTTTDGLNTQSNVAAISVAASPALGVAVAAGSSGPNTALFNVTFTSAIDAASFTASDFVVTGTTVVPVLTQTSPTTATLSFSGLTAGAAVGVTLPANTVTAPGTAGNTAASNTATVTVAGPTTGGSPALAVAVAGGPSTGTSAVFNVSFSSPIDAASFTAADLAITGAGSATPVITQTSPTTFTVTLSGLTSGAVVTAQVVANGVTAPGTAGNTTASNTASVTVGSGTAVSPALAVAVAAGVAPANGALFNVSFSSPIDAASFTAADLVTSGIPAGTVPVITQTSPTTFTVAFSGLSGGSTVTLGLAANGVTAPGTAGNTTASPVASVTVTGAATPGTLTKLFAVGTGAGSAASVQVFDSATGVLRYTLSPFEPTFTGGANVSTADVNGDGVEDIIVGAGFGGGPRVRVFSGSDGSTIADFYAYDSNMRGGVSVGALSTGVAGSKASIVTGSGVGIAPTVRTFTYNGTATPSSGLSFSGMEPSFTGGITVAGGDVNGDGVPDIVVGAGAGGGPRVAVYNGSTGAAEGSFFAYAQNFTGGVFVATSGGQIVTGAGVGGGSVVSTFTGTGTPVRSFNAYEGAVTSGVRVAGETVNGVNEILTTPGAGGARVLTFRVDSSAQIGNFFAFGGANSANGFFIG